MGHAEVAKAPGQGGNDRQEAEGARGPVRPVVTLGNVQIAGKLFGVGNDDIHAACLADPEKDDDHKGDGHENTLDQVCGRYSQETAQGRVGNDNDCAYDHGQMVFHTEQAVEQGAYSLEAGRGIRNKENQDDQGGDQGNTMLFISVTVGKVFRDRKGAQSLGIAAQQPGDQQEVQVGTHGKTDGRPCDLRQAGDISQSGQTHQKITAHVRGLRAHGGDQRAQRTAANIEAVGSIRRALPVKDDADHQHGEQIGSDSCNDQNLCGCHNLSFSLFGPGPRNRIRAGL